MASITKCYQMLPIHLRHLKAYSRSSLASHQALGMGMSFAIFRTFFDGKTMRTWDINGY